MSSETQPRTHATGPTPVPGDVTTVIPRQHGPWTVPPRAVHGPSNGRPVAPPHGWSAPPPGFGPAGPAGPVPPGPVGPPVPTRPGMRWGWIVIAVVAAIAAVALIGTVASSHRTAALPGSVTVYGMTGLVSPGSSCSNSSMSGKPVTIFDASGDLVGTTTLTGYGTATNQWGYSSGYADSCRYDFTLSDVVLADSYYRVALGSDASRGVGFSRDQLESTGAHITYGR